MKISDLQRKRPYRTVHVRADALMRDVVSVLDRSGFGAVIVSGGPNVLEGLISERDVVQGLAAHGPSFLEMEARKIAVTARGTCSPDEYVRDVAGKMIARRVDCMAVRDRNALFDVIGLDEIVAAQQADQRRRTRSLVTLMSRTRLHAL